MSLFFDEVDLRGHTIALDLDDTQIPCTDEIRQFLSARGKHKEMHEFTRDLAHIYFDGDRQEWHAACEAFYETYRPQPLPGFIEIARELMRAEAELLIVSARPERHLEYATEHVKMIFMDAQLPVPEVICCGREEESPTQGGCKTPICVRRNVSVLIDDMPKHVHYAQRAGLIGLLFGDYPWSDLKQAPAADRLRTWDPNHVLGALRPIFR